MHHSGPTAEAFAQASSHVDAVVTAHSIKYERTVMDVDGSLRMCASKYMTDFATDAEKEQIDVDTIRFSDLVYLTGERGNGGKTMVRGTFEMSATPCDKSEKGSPQLTPSFKAIADAVKLEGVPQQSPLLKGSGSEIASAPVSEPTTPALAASLKVQRFRADAKRMILRAECELDSFAADLEVKLR